MKAKERMWKLVDAFVSNASGRGDAIETIASTTTIASTCAVMLCLAALTCAGETVSSAAGGWFAVDAREVKDTTLAGGVIVAGETNLVLQCSPNAWGAAAGGDGATVAYSNATTGVTGMIAENTTAETVDWTPNAPGTFVLTHTVATSDDPIVLTATFCVEEKHVHSGIEWQMWPYSTALPTEAGSWYLRGDVTLGAAYAPVDGVVICLNGHTVTGAAGQHVISVAEGNTFTLFDCGATGKVTGGTGVEVAGTFRQLGGTVAVTDVTGTYTVGAKAVAGVTLPNGTLIGVDTEFPLENGAKIGVTTATLPTETTSVAVTGANAADIHGYFFSDDSTYYAKNGDDNAVQLGFVTNPTVKNTSGGDTTVEIPKTWRETYKPTGEEIMEPEKPMANGMPAWQNYVLGLDPTNKLSGVYADAPQNGKAGAVTIETKNLDTSKIAEGYGVKYRLDTKLRGATAYTKGSSQESANFDVAVDGDDPTGLYQLNAVLFKGETELDQAAAAINTVGLVKAANTNKYCIIAVPWGALAPGEEQEIAVSNIVKTANLAAGDKLHVYRFAKGTYDTWTLKGDGTWGATTSYKLDKNGKVTAETSGDPQEATIARGNGIWLERATPTDTPYFLYGQYSESAPAVTLEKGYNLLAAPGLEAYDLANVTGAADGDEILVPGAQPKVFTYKDGEWGYYKTVKVTLPGTTIFDGVTEGVKSVWTTDDSTIPAGTGFWLINKSGTIKVK